MTFEGYLHSIKSITGNSPDDFKILAEQKGFLHDGHIKPGIKQSEIVDWLKQDFGLGHGHAMAIYAFFRETKDGNSNLFQL